MIFVTGSSGFIGSNFISNYLKKYEEKILGIDCLTYASNIPLLKNLKKEKRFIFKKLNISDYISIKKLFEEYKPTRIINFAAESHVDKSILGPDIFIQTNILGTFNLLKCSLAYQKKLNFKEAINFKFIHISTDEVFGSLNDSDDPSTELSQYKPNSPYAATKASSDHIVRSFNKTFNLNTIITNCSNNYGPYQFPEKLIPLVINNCINMKSLPVYGDGKNIRDWIHVDDHCDALFLLSDNGNIGENYNIGGNNQISNIDLVRMICEILDKILPSNKIKSYKDLITFINDRPGHDKRYSIDISKISKDVGWFPKINIDDGLRHTITWYLENSEWLEKIKSREFDNWIKQQYNL